ncbi:MAG: hypothetical protein NLN65_07670, partial [Candidatus Poseidoniaceae archaeon]|nr:hypothetical protein [Candidatus Poseidoniaceae archaeon]
LGDKALMSAPEAIEDNYEFMVAIKEDEVKPWLQYEEDNRTDKHFNNLQTDAVLELLEPCEKLEGKFKLFMQTELHNGEEWAVTMDKTWKAAKSNIHIAEEIYVQVKNDWIQKELEHERKTTHEEVLKAGIAENLHKEERSQSQKKRDKIRAAQAYREEGRPVIAPRFAKPIEAILTEADIVTKEYLVIKSSRRWAIVTLKGKVLNKFETIAGGWAEQYRKSNVMTWVHNVEVAFQKWLEKTIEGEVYFQDNRRGLDINAQNLEILEQMTQGIIDKKIEDKHWTSIPEQRQVREEELKTRKGQEELWQEILDLEAKFKMHKRREELDQEPHKEAGKARLRMLAERIVRHKAETEPTLFDLTQQIKDEEIEKKVIIFTEILQRTEEHQKSRVDKDYLTKATEDAVYHHKDEPLPLHINLQHYHQVEVDQAPSSSPAMDIAREGIARKRKQKDDDKSDGSEEVLLTKNPFQHRRLKKEKKSKGSVSACTSKKKSQSSSSSDSTSTNDEKVEADEDVAEKMQIEEYAKDPEA